MKNDVYYTLKNNDSEYLAYYDKTLDTQIFCWTMDPNKAIRFEEHKYAKMAANWIKYGFGLDVVKLKKSGENWIESPNNKHVRPSTYKGVGVA